MAEERSDVPVERDGISSAVVEHLRGAIRQAIKDHETAEVVELLCENSGLTLEEFLQAPHELRVLEVFLLSTSELPQLRLFPYLTVVKIIHVGLESMRSLSCLHHVEELWLNENNICRIEGLQQMQRLRRLFLQGNMIEDMDGIPYLPQLQELWLCGNQLRHITRLNVLPVLVSLWVASNRITTLGNAFTSSMTSIQELNLSNNKIYFLDQLTHLGVLKSLRRVWFSDPMYGDAPICHLSNYTTFSLRHLLHLEQLDGVAITAEQRTLAISVYAKKSIYYSMRRAILDRNISILFARVHQEAEAKRDLVRKTLRQLNLEITALGECVLDGSPTNQAAMDEEKQHMLKLRVARDRHEAELGGLERQLLDAQERTIFESDSLHERLLLELNSCGNIRLEEGSLEDTWCASAKELVSSRFDATLYESLGITGVKVNRVFRIMCQGQRERFDNRMRELDVDLVDTRSRRALVRLFSAVPKNVMEQRRFLHEIMINGFSGLYAEDDGVPLTNSLYYADQERLMSTTTTRRDVYGVRVPLESFSGQLVVSRLFLGKCVSEMGASREQEANGDVPFMKSERRRRTRRQYGEEVFSIYRVAPHDTSVKVWHMFDKSLVLPEYVIDFTYTTKVYRFISPLLSVYDDLAVLEALIEKNVPGVTPDCVADIRTVGYPLFSFLKWLDSSVSHVLLSEETQNVLRKAEELRRLRSVVFQASGILTNALVEAYKNQVSTSTESPIVLCDMSGQKITCIPASISTTNAWTSLTQLFLQGNKISSIAWEALALVAPALEKLDLGNNVLNRLEFAAAHFPVLHWLCLSCNKLHALDDLLPLRGGLPMLKSLDIDHNPWMENKLAEVFCFAVLPQLQHLNEIPISRHASLFLRQKRTIVMDQRMLQYIVAEERKRQTQDAAGGVMTYNDGDQMGNVDVVKIASFEAVFAELMEKTERDRASLASTKKDSSMPPLRSVRNFYFRFSLMRDLTWVSLLPQLRHLCLQSHVIEDLTPLAELRHLKTLNLSGNLVKTAKPLAGMRLVSLDLARNQLTGIECLDEMNELRFLSVTENAITHVAALQHCRCLEEFYFARNLICDVRDLHPLHRLPNLVSIDAAGNPCSGYQDTEQKRWEYRNYLVYNLPKLKVLDGVPIGEVEQRRARDVFAGRVNAELLVERVGSTSQWKTAHEVDLSLCGLREVTMMEPFVSLKVLHLHHNSIAHIDGLLSLHNLVALNLSHNRLGQCPVGHTLQHLHNLRSLSLESNHITDISALGLLLPRLKFLNLKGNEITFIDQGLQGLTDLRELLLDNNKLRALGPDCFVNNLQLTDISAEENCIRSTEGLQPLIRLGTLDLASNRLGDLRLLLNDLRNATCLATATFLGNSVARKPPYRAQTIAALPALAVLDNKEVTDEERDKAEMMRTTEYSAPHSIVLDPSFSLDAVGGVRVSGAAVQPRVFPNQTQRLPVNSNPRPHLPAYKNARPMPQMRDSVRKGVVPRVQGGS
ncbi:hypothetical protein TraAM80_00293 [Trypanosoma rangeli]|uniref:Leucine-rich repeat protein (LRRP) n=1 Tax=Trypanosoma rangeli TaxID=5698 RepID=A0A422P3Z1_TRYRA|nr:uncharacterized protein TraAM80_00293 [Trypanosoma rangeli]RNF12441.1 hypothetical protein TraAM80_00293 [Trypanosoma rangeli]|eukprot:RNF12441.1 hypothetical protein TraAM80_00293 [Trypanosoma rangeli]